MTPRISLSSLRAFEAAARFSSFALAAAELRLTPSAVSHQIKLLEMELGVSLFHRAHRSVVLTDAGRQYADEISAAFARIEMATRDIGRSKKFDILTVHSAPSFAAQWLMPRLAQFGLINSGVDVRLNASPTPVDLGANSVDIDIRYGSAFKTTDTTTIALPFPPETIVPMCSPKLLESGPALRTPQDLAHFTLIHSEFCLVGWRDWRRRHPDVPLETTRGPRFDRSFISIGAAVDGLGVCLESLLLAQRELQTGRLVAPLGLDGLTVHGYTFNVLKTQAHLQKIRTFRTWIFDELALPFRPG